MLILWSLARNPGAQLYIPIVCKKSKATETHSGCSLLGVEAVGVMPSGGAVAQGVTGWTRGHCSGHAFSFRLSCFCIQLHSTPLPLLAVERGGGGQQAREVF